MLSRSSLRSLSALFGVGHALRIAPAPTVIHHGDATLPPLVELPGSPLPLPVVVKPPSPAALYDWSVDHGKPDADPSWASVWPCAAALASHLASQPSLVEGKNVVELGAGLGVVGLVAANLGAETTTLIDQEGLALQCAMATAERCELSIAAVGSAAADGVVRAAAADWAAEPDGLTANVVLASEVLYAPLAVPTLAGCAARLLRRGGVLLVADPKRERAVGCRAALAAEATRLGATVSETPLSAMAAEAEEMVLVRVEFPSNSQPRAAGRSGEPRMCAGGDGDDKEPIPWDGPAPLLSAANAGPLAILAVVFLFQGLAALPREDLPPIIQQLIPLVLGRQFGAPPN